MLKFTLKTSYITVLCCLLSGCGLNNVSSFVVTSNSNQQLIQNTDKIVFLPEYSYEAYSGFDNQIKSIIETKFNKLGYTVVSYNQTIKPTLIATYYVSELKDSHTVKQEVCHYENIKNPNDPNDLSNPNDVMRICQYEDATVDDYTYFCNFFIYRPDTLCDNQTTEQCIMILKKQTDKTLFSSRIQFTKDKPLDTGNLYPMMIKAVLETFPLHQTSEVFFQNTPEGYIPTQIETTTKKN